MTEEVTNDILNSMLEASEAVDSVILVCSAVIALSLEDFDSESWESLQACMGTNIELLEYLKMTITEGSKLVGNDAVLSHIEAVVTAD